MGVYVRGIKISEDASSVTYRYGTNYEAEGGGTFKIPKQNNLMEHYKTFVPTVAAWHVFKKVVKYYNEHGVFPDAVSFQS